MIPYFTLTTLSLGPFTIHVWGLMAAIGFLVATIVAARRVRTLSFSGLTRESRNQLTSDLVWQASWQIVLASMVGARLFEVFFYEPRYYVANPAAIFSIWDGGMSSYGGIIGGALVLGWFIRRHKLPLLQTLDVFAYAAPLGIMFGRIGCFLIHDHPGTLTSMVWGVRYPDGTVRHDGGLEMAIADGIIFLFLVLLARRSPSPRVGEGWGEVQLPPGSFVVLFLGLKGLARFWLDFYRAADIAGAEARYFGLTPSQYVGALTIFFVLWWYVCSHKRSTRLASR